MLEAPAVLTPVVTPGGDWGHVARKTKPEGERKNARRAASNFTLAQAGVPIKRDGKCSPPAPTSVGNAVGRCRCMVCAGLAIFRTHHICCVFGVQICPNCFRLPQPHMRLGRVEWEALSTTHSVGEQRGQKGGGTRKQIIGRKISVENPRLKIPSWNRGSRICNSETIQERRSGCQPNSFLLKKLLRESKRLPRLGRKPTELCSCRKTIKLRFPKSKFWMLDSDKFQ